jgi:imidazolonepropionase-like amidohydrolase
VSKTTRYLFTNARIFDGSGKAPFLGEVSVEGNVIADVSRQGQGISPEGAEIVDASGATLMPGLVESHAHLTWPSSVERVVNAMRLPLEEHLLVTAQNARITLEHGFTSAYSAGSLGEKFEPVLRNMIDAGYFVGPRLRASALEKGAEGVMGVPAGHDPTHDRSLDGLRSYIREMKALGCDTIKFLMSSDEGFAPGGSQTLMYSEEEAQVIGETAREEGVWLAAHAQAAEAIKRAVRAGFRSIYHCTHCDDEALDMLEREKERVFISPAPGLLYARCYEASEFGIGRKQAEAMGAVSGLESMQRIIPEMRKRGVRVLPGGDYGFPYNPIGRNARDLELFVKLFGFSHREALVAATRDGGALMDLPVGEIQPGKLADLLVVKGEPDEDVTVLQDKSNLLAIMKDGKFFKRTSFDAGAGTDARARLIAPELPRTLGEQTTPRAP